MDPGTGAAIWSHKGNELRGSAPAFVEPVGHRGDFLLVGSKTQNLLVVLSPARFQPINCYVQTPVESCCVDYEGAFGYFASQNRITSFNVSVFWVDWRFRDPILPVCGIFPFI